MAYIYSGDKHSVIWLVKNFNEGKLDTSISIQRREVWTPQMKSNLITSLIIGIPINPILLEEATNYDGNYMVIDGKQRTLTICEFLNGDFKLSKHMRIPNYDGFDYVDKKFTDIPERVQERIKDRELQFIVNHPMEEDERAKLFYFWNQAAPLSPAELIRAGLGEQIMDKVQSLTDHDFMISKVKITKPARKKYEDFQQLILYAMLQKAYNDGTEIGFSKPEVATFCDDLKLNPNLLNTDRIQEVLNYLDDAFETKQDYLKKANLPMIFLSADLALKDKVLPDDFFNWADELFKRLSENPEYLKLCKSYKRGDVMGRMNVVVDAAKADLLGKKKKKPVSRKKAKTDEAVEETAVTIEEVYVPADQAEMVDVPANVESA